MSDNFKSLAIILWMSCVAIFDLWLLVKLLSLLSDGDSG